MRSQYFTHEDYDAALEMHVAENKRKHNQPTEFTWAKFMRRLPLWKRAIIKMLRG